MWTHAHIFKHKLTMHRAFSSNIFTTRSSFWFSIRFHACFVSISHTPRSSLFFASPSCIRLHPFRALLRCIVSSYRWAKVAAMLGQSIVALTQRMRFYLLLVLYSSVLYCSVGQSLSQSQSGDCISFFQYSSRLSPPWEQSSTREGSCSSGQPGSCINITK